MTTNDYRADYLSRHGGSRTRADAGDPPTDAIADGRSDRDVLAVIADPDASTADRVAAIDVAGADAIVRPEVMRALIDLLATTGDDPAVRRAARTTLAQLSFSTGEFAPYEADYRNALRVAATDADPQLAEGALAVLAQVRDDYAQRIVLAGLQDPSQAVVSRQRALRLLGHDLHAAQFPLLRDIATTKAADPVERVTAVRLLAADSDSASMFEQFVADRSEEVDVRVASAIALHNLDPGQFAATAEGIVLDSDDDDDLRAVCLTALAVTPEAAPVRYGPRALAEAVLNAPTPPSDELSRAVEQYRAAKASDAGN